MGNEEKSDREQQRKSKRTFCQIKKFPLLQ